jgi:hypothetical protein
LLGSHNRIDKTRPFPGLTAVGWIENVGSIHPNYLSFKELIAMALPKRCVTRSISSGIWDFLLNPKYQGGNSKEANEQNSRKSAKPHTSATGRM